MKSTYRTLNTSNTSACIVALLTLGAGNSALAQSAGCTDINGLTRSVAELDFDALISDKPLTAGETVVVSGSWFDHEGTTSDGWYVSDPFTDPLVPLSAIFTAIRVPFSETFVVPHGGMLSFGLAGTARYGGFGDLSITCSSGSSAVGSAPVVLPSLAQQQAITTSLSRNYRNRFGMSGDVSQPSFGVFASSKGQAEEISVWFSMTSRTYWDGYEGNAFDLTFGLDKFVSANLLTGVMVGVNRLSVSNAAGATTDATAAMLGVYAAHSFANGTLTDAHIAWSRVSYVASGSKFDTNRWALGVAVAGSIEQASGTLQPRARISGIWEDFPTGVSGIVAGTTEQYLVAIGTRFDWKEAWEGTTLKPFVSVDLEYGSLKDTSNFRDVFLAPRFGFGLNGMVGAGFLSANVDVGRSASDVFDAGLDLNYELSF